MVDRDPIERVIADIQERLNSDFGLTCCDECEDCGPLSMCRYHSALSEIDLVLDALLGSARLQKDEKGHAQIGSHEMTTQQAAAGCIKPEGTQMEWQPISTAPKYAGGLLFYEPPMVGRHDGIVVSGDMLEGEHGCVPCDERGRSLNATHWMYLPDPPQSPSVGASTSEGSVSVNPEKSNE